MEDVHWCSKCILLLHLTVLYCLLHTAFTLVEYKVVNDLGRDRESAKIYCLTNGFTGLAILDSKEKRDAVLLSPEYHGSTHYWVGMIQTNRTHPRVDTFQWESATATSWVRWARNFPVQLDDRPCVELENIDQYFANIRCDIRYYFICEIAHDPPTMGTAAAPHVVSSGYYALIHKDQNLQSSYPHLVVLTESTRSEIECMTLCAKDLACKYVIFKKSDRQCTAYSSALKDQSYELEPEMGTNIRERQV